MAAPADAVTHGHSRAEKHRHMETSLQTCTAHYAPIHTNGDAGTRRHTDLVRPEQHHPAFAPSPKEMLTDRLVTKEGREGKQM